MTSGAVLISNLSIQTTFGVDSLPAEKPQASLRITEVCLIEGRMYKMAATQFCLDAKEYFKNALFLYESTITFPGDPPVQQLMQAGSLPRVGASNLQVQMCAAGTSKWVHLPCI